MTKKLVTRYQWIDLEDNIGEVINKLQKALEEGWEAVEHSTGDSAWDPNESNYLIKQELETNEEYIERTNKEKCQAEIQAEGDRREYERLKKKFEQPLL